MSNNSPMGERMARMEEKTDNIEKKVDNIQETLDKFINCAPNRFSAKWVEKGMLWMVLAVCGAVLTAVLAEVIH